MNKILFENPNRKGTHDAEGRRHGIWFIEYNDLYQTIQYKHDVLHGINKVFVCNEICIVSEFVEGVQEGETIEID